MKHAGGRPTKYNAQFHPKLAKALAKLGKTLPEIAEEFEVAPSTVSKWMVDHKEFSEALKTGRDFSDDLVEESLYKNAIGYEHEIEKPMVVSVGQGEGSEVQIVRYKEKVPGQTASQIFWLKNRRPDRWRDKVEQIHSGEVNVNQISPEKRKKRIEELQKKTAE